MGKQTKETPSAAENRRLAAIDIGTNSIRCIVVEASETGGFRVLDDEKATVRLGEGLSSSGRISAPAIERARESLQRMKKITEGLGVEVIESVATSAIRRAANGGEFLETIRKECGLDIRVISGEEEAELALESASHQFEIGSGLNVVFDIGGGSVEIVIAAGHHVEQIVSLDLGAVFLTETFLTKDPLSEKDVKQLRQHVRRELKKALNDQGVTARVLIGSGGTVTSIGSMVMAMRKEQYHSLNGYEVLRSEVVHLLAMLSRKDLKERRAVAGLSSERADIIVAGVALVDELMGRFGSNILRINDRGIREGLIIKSLQKHGLLSAPNVARDWRSSTLALAQSCHLEDAHGQNVARLALEIFDALSPATPLAPRDRELLEAAALLHDIGYFISYSAHHKHSYHLIRHAHLFGFSPKEREIIANLARYHRKSLPKKTHENFQRLTPDDQQRVKMLGGILRLADGLDRRRSGAVRRIDCRVADNRLELRLHGEGDLSVEIHGAQAKSDLIRRAFAIGVELMAAG